MRFKVSGADAATGVDATVEVEAAGRAEAELRARERGIFVSAVEPVAVVGRTGRVAGTRRRRRLAVAASTAVLLVPLLVCWVNVKDTLFVGPDAARHDARADDRVGAAVPAAPAPRFTAGPPGPFDGGGTVEPGVARSTDPADGRLAGTFRTRPGASTDLSITFDRAGYMLNPSRTLRWTRGTRGTWSLHADHPDLTAREREEGWHVLTMNAPDDGGPGLTAHVRLDVDAAGRVGSVTLASFRGVRFPPSQHLTLVRDDASSPWPSASTAAPDDGGDGAGRTGAAEAGLGRAGYATGRCLICGSARSPLARAAHSDRRGFGLCDPCGAEYATWKRVLARGEAGLGPTPDDLRAAEGFKRIMSEHFRRDDPDGRRGVGMLFLVGKFASGEWDALTRGGGD